jgi:hypothetical protein
MCGDCCVPAVQETRLFVQQRIAARPVVIEDDITMHRIENIRRTTHRYKELASQFHTGMVVSYFVDDAVRCGIYAEQCSDIPSRAIVLCSGRRTRVRLSELLVGDLRPAVESSSTKRWFRWWVR